MSVGLSSPTLISCCPTRCRPKLKVNTRNICDIVGTHFPVSQCYHMPPPWSTSHGKLQSVRPLHSNSKVAWARTRAKEWQQNSYTCVSEDTTRSSIFLFLLESEGKWRDSRFHTTRRDGPGWPRQRHHPSASSSSCCYNYRSLKRTITRAISGYPKHIPF